MAQGWIVSRRGIAGSPNIDFFAGPLNTVLSSKGSSFESIVPFIMKMRGTGTSPSAFVLGAKVWFQRGIGVSLGAVYTGGITFVGPTGPTGSLTSGGTETQSETFVGPSLTDLPEKEILFPSGQEITNVGETIEEIVRRRRIEKALERGDIGIGDTFQGIPVSEIVRIEVDSQPALGRPDIA